MTETFKAMLITASPYIVESNWTLRHTIKCLHVIAWIKSANGLDFIFSGYMKSTGELSSQRGTLTMFFR